MKLIGIGGTNGSGKDTLAKILSERHNYLVVSVSDFLRDELRRQNLPIERENLRALSAKWRQASGLGVLIDKAIDVYKTVQARYEGLVIPSIRNPGEVDEIHKYGGLVVWTDGDPKLRYQRIYSRARGTEDQKTYKQFLAEEQAEMDHGGTETALHMTGVKAKADIFITNDHDSIEEFKQAVEQALKPVL